MNRAFFFGLLAFAWAGCDLALAQGTTSPPAIVGTPQWFIIRDELTVNVFIPFNIECGSEFTDAEPFNPLTDVASEGDFIFVEVEIFQEEIDEEQMGGGGQPPPDQMPMELDVFVRPQAFFVPFGIYVSPEPPPLIEAESVFIQLNANRVRDDNMEDRRRLCYGWRVPQWNGRNQARLRGDIDYDVLWSIQFGISLTEDPQPGEFIEFFSPLFAIKDARFLGPNPPAFADAGADKIVVAGSTISLDGGLTFDGTNVGFDPSDPSIFEEDQLTFTWEWVSGPTRVDPTYPDPSNRPQIAEVTLTQVGVYVFRLLVDDGVNGAPNSDTVQIEVVSSLPQNRAPTSTIQDLIAPVVVGGIIQLNGGGSSDPDGDVLSYRWVQTNEIGGAVDPAVFLDTFQPLAGLDDPVSTWQALKAGTYYFRLLVSDGIEQDSDTTVVQVVSTALSGAGSPRNPGAVPTSSGPDAENIDTAAPLAPTGCGATPLGMIGLSLAGLSLGRRRRT